MVFLVHKIQHCLKSLCRAIQCVSTISLVIFIIYVYRTSVGSQWNRNVLTPAPPRAECSANMPVTREGCVSCPRGTFSFPGWSECIPWLNCSEISLQVHPRKRIGRGVGVTKLIWLADWKGYQVVLMECSPKHSHKRKRCTQGMTILEQIQGEFVTRLIGKCNHTLQMVTMYYKLGSARFLDRLLRRPSLSKYNNIQTRFQLSVDYVRIMDYLHNSPIGVRVQCDGVTPHKLLSQYLITDDFHLVMNDMDRLQEVTEDQGCDGKRPNVSRAQQLKIKRQGWPTGESKPLPFHLHPTYDEKVEIWKLPWIVERLLDDVEGSYFAKRQLREIMGKCHAINPRQRPSANEVLQELLRVQQLIVTNSSFSIKSR